jgi:pimeloyl-ACP methyl ester carboxylesterase
MTLTAGKLTRSAAVALALASPQALSQPAMAVDAGTTQATQVQYRGAEVDGVHIAYREAGDPSRPTVVLLHGFPTSSHMFRDLIPQLADRYHVIAPDYPGFGASAMPPADQLDHSFANLARLMTALIDQKGAGRYAAYVMDYGAPVGYRMFANDPERVTGFIIQNGNAYEEGLRAFLTMDATKWQFTHGTRNPEGISPENFWHVQYGLDRPGNQEVQLELFLDYGTNVPECPKWQALLRQHQPPALLMWGKGDPIFPEEGAHPYRRDLTDLEFYILDTGHFALEEDGPLIAPRVRAFLNRIHD